MDGFPELTIGEVADGPASRRRDPLLRAHRPAARAGPYGRAAPLRPGVLGKLGFIGVAQSAGFKLREIKELIDGVERSDGLGEQMRSLSPKARRGRGAARADQGDAGLARGRQGVRLREPEECALFPEFGEESLDAGTALKMIRVDGGDCRRSPAE